MRLLFNVRLQRPFWSDVRQSPLDGGVDAGESTLYEVRLRSLLPRLWNVSPLRLVGPAGQGDLLSPKWIGHSVASRLLEPLDSLPVFLTSDGTSPPFSVLCVYRRRNAAHVEALGVPRRSDPDLWALDEKTSQLAERTQGVGPGSRFALVNRLLAATPQPGWLVVIDDDVRFTRAHFPTRLGLRRVARSTYVQFPTAGGVS